MPLGDVAVRAEHAELVDEVGGACCEAVPSQCLEALRVHIAPGLVPGARQRPTLGRGLTQSGCAAAHRGGAPRREGRAGARCRGSTGRAARHRSAGAGMRSSSASTRAMPSARHRSLAQPMTSQYTTPRSPAPCSAPTASTSVTNRRGLVTRRQGTSVLLPGCGSAPVVAARLVAASKLAHQSSEAGVPARPDLRHAGVLQVGVRVHQAGKEHAGPVHSLTGVVATLSACRGPTRACPTCRIRPPWTATAPLWTAGCCHRHDDVGGIDGDRHQDSRDRSRARRAISSSAAAGTGWSPGGEVGRSAAVRQQRAGRRTKGP